MIELEEVTFGYAQQAPLFQDYTWTVLPAETWAVLGPSGCGKTTLLYLLSGLRFPDTGQVLIQGERLTRPRPHTGLILQDYGLLPWATVRQNADLGLRLRQFYGPDGRHAPLDFRITEVRSEVDSMLVRVGLDGVAEKYPSQISGGQRQRTAIARTLVLDPDLLLMDEPFSSLDAPTRENLQDLTLDLCVERSITLVIVTHTIEEAAYLGKKILLLQRPPNQTPQVIENPRAGQPDYRHSQEYTRLCRMLRAKMDRP